MESIKKLYTDFLCSFARELPKAIKQEIINTPTEELNKFHFSVGLKLRNTLFNDLQTFFILIMIFGETNPDMLSSNFIKELKLYLTKK